MSDTEIVNWLQQKTSRLLDVYWRIENEDVTVREAVEWLVEAQKDILRKE